MNADNLHDAISLLPDDLLEPVDALRRKKRIPVRSLTALAACVCLVAGLWLFAPDAFRSENKNAGAAMGDGIFEEDSNSLSGQTPEKPEAESKAFLTARVVEIKEDYIVVLSGSTLTDTAKPVTVKLSNLKTVPQLEEGQSIRIYCEEFPEDDQPLVPYCIEINQE